MNNTFNIGRFCNYAKMNYWYHKREYLVSILIVAALLTVKLCNFNFSFMAKTWESDLSPVQRIADYFSQGYYLMGVLFTVLIIRISMQGINGRSLTMHDALIPVSTFERYIFAILNSTVVAVVVYTFIFQIVSTFAESMYLFSDNGYVFKGFIGYNDSTVTNGQFVQECNLSLYDIIFNRIYINAPSQHVATNSIIICYTMFVSAFMWGEITFQRRSAAVLTILVHLALVIVSVSLFATANYENQYPTAFIRVSYDVKPTFDNYQNYLIYILYLFPITYQWVVWKKLKNISLTK